MKRLLLAMLFPTAIALASCSNVQEEKTMVHFDSRTPVDSTFAINGKYPEKIVYDEKLDYDCIKNLDYYFGSENHQENFLFDLCKEYSERYSIVNGYGAWVIDIDYTEPQGDIFVVNLSLTLSFTRPQVKLGGVDKIITTIRNYKPIYTQYKSGPEIVLAPISSSLYESSLDVLSHQASGGNWVKETTSEDFVIKSDTLSKYPTKCFPKIKVTKREAPLFTKYSFGVINPTTDTYVNKYNGSALSFKKILISNFNKLVETDIPLDLVFDNIRISSSATQPWVVDAIIYLKYVFIETGGSQFIEVKGCQIA